MKRIFYLIANGMAAFLDFSVGMLIALVLAMYMGVAQDHIAIRLLTGGMLALLPDFDLAVALAQQALTGKKLSGNHHASHYHWPLIMVPAAGIIGYWAGGLYLELMVVLCLVAHYIHDAAMMGPRAGLAWLTRYQRTPIYDPSQQLEHSEWLEQKWLSSSILSATELTLGGFMLTATIFLITGNLEHVVIVTLLPLGCATAIWNLKSTSKSW